MSKDFEKCEVKLMKQHLEDYIEVIKQLPLKKKYTKDELLIPELLVKKHGATAPPSAAAALPPL